MSGVYLPGPHYPGVNRAMKQTKYLSARIPATLFEQLDNAAENEEGSRTDIVIKALRQYFSKENLPKEDLSFVKDEIAKIKNSLTKRIDTLEVKTGDEIRTLTEKVQFLSSSLRNPSS
jgi:metal-responsive CopG/Arc/MetJ family transcriptional regulator